jgi:hypothetical protein
MVRWLSTWMNPGAGIAAYLVAALAALMAAADSAIAGELS